MRIIFAGSPGIAVPSLFALSAMECRGDGIELLGVLTNIDAPQGRKGRLSATEVSLAAAALTGPRKERGYPPLLQLKFEKLDTQARKEIAFLGCDLLITFAYGRIFGPKFLALFSNGGINVHPSLLPRFRGPSPIPAAILARDRETGITIQELALQMDTGNILAQETIPLDERETAASLTEKVANKAAEMLPALIARLLAGPVLTEPQMGEAVYCFLIRKEQGLIDWELPAVEIDAQVRAYSPWPLSYTQWEGEKLYFLEGSARESNLSNSEAGLVKGIDRDYGILIQTGNGVYATSRLQRRAKKALNWKDFINGARDFVGNRLE